MPHLPGAIDMPHFTRLTEIVTCNLSALISAAEDQRS